MGGQWNVRLAPPPTVMSIGGGEVGSTKGLSSYNTTETARAFCSTALHPIQPSVSDAAPRLALILLCWGTQAPITCSTCSYIWVFILAIYFLFFGKQRFGLHTDTHTLMVVTNYTTCWRRFSENSWCTASMNSFLKFRVMWFPLHFFPEMSWFITWNQELHLDRSTWSTGVCCLWNWTRANPTIWRGFTSYIQK